MRILFVPLALLLLALCSFTFSLEAAKSEDNRGESVGGMEETPDGEYPGWNNSVNSYEKRAVGRPYDFGLKHFKKDNSECKCLRDEYCMKKKSNGKGYEKVNGCGESTCYTLCEAFGCREVCKGQCKCEFGRCEVCSDRGCKQVTKCDRAYNTYKSSCQECSKIGECREEKCVRLCSDDKVTSADIFIQDKCFCKKDSDGKDKDCQMCDKYRCKPIASCDRFTQCTCNNADDSYTRCYGFIDGKRECRRVGSCTSAKHNQRLEDVRRVFNPPTASYLGRRFKYAPIKCKCPSVYGFCEMCIRGEEKPESWVDVVWGSEPTICAQALREECPLGSIEYY